MIYVLMAVFSAVIIAADQLSKLWVLKNIPLYALRDGINGLFRLTYVQNTGAAFSSFQGMQWLFFLIFALFTIAMIWEFFKKRLPFTTFDRWCILAVFSGGLGNMIDRLRLGFVVDMIDLQFADGSVLAWLNTFPVFNVADCFICCGCIGLMVSLIFFNKAFWKDGKKE